MSLLMRERLYQLLPAVHRVRDAEQGEPLRALLSVIEEELERIEADTAALYDNWFIETCDEWVVPYIGDLLGARPIRPIESAGVSARAYVANTIAYRRRKGTAVVLEQLAFDTTGWRAHAVEFFQRLATTPHVNHVRSSPTASPGIRDAELAERAGDAKGAFDPFAHTAEVRRAATRRGRFNIPNIGLFLWRLGTYSVGVGSPGDIGADFASARQRGPWWSVHPVGCDSPLFHAPHIERTITQLAQEVNLPGPLRALSLGTELGRGRRGITTPAPRFMSADEPALRVWARLADDSAPVEIRREDMYLCEVPDSVELATPTPRALAFDPSRGRLAFARGLDVREVWVQSTYGFAGDLGGGPYDRNAAVRAANRLVALELDDGAEGGFFDPGVWQVGVSHLLPTDGSDPIFPSLRDAIAAWNLLPPGRTGVIVLMDSLTEVLDGDGSPSAPLEIELAEGSQLIIVAGEWTPERLPGALPGVETRVPGHFEARKVRAHVLGDWIVRGTAPSDSSSGGACFLNGVLLEGSLTVAPGNLGRLSLAHSTLVPDSGQLLIDAAGNDRLTLSIGHSICASVQVNGAIGGVKISDSIVCTDGSTPARSVDAAQTALDLERSSFFGCVNALSLSASDCLFCAPVQASRRQIGCVRFCYVPPGSATPRRYRCQPDLETRHRIAEQRASAPANTPPDAAIEQAIRDEVAAQIRPLFVSREYGAAGFGQLELRCAPQIRTGAQSGAEMGAFEFLKQPQREANLRDALDEYLRFGLDAALHFVT